MTGAEDDRPGSDIKIGQALYTWAEVLPSGKQGEGFVAASPSLAHRIDWLNASCRSLIGYVGNRYKVTAEQRAQYKPVGRHIHADKTFVYRKSDAGKDSHKRAGNYLIHFLVADSYIISLSDALRIQQSSWDFRAAHVTATASGRLQSMPEVDLKGFRHQLESFAEFKEPDRSLVIEALLEMTRTGILDATDLDKAAILGMLSVLPHWVDYAAELITEWSEHGPVKRLHLLDRQPTGVVGEDRRYTPVSDDLRDLRERLASASTIDELRSSLASCSTLDKPAPAGAMKTESAKKVSSLDECIEKWLAKAESMTKSERELLVSMSPSDLVGALAQQERRLPSWQDRDDIALFLLERCEGADQKLLSAIMPLGDESVSRYVTICTNSTVLEAAVWLNCDKSRHIDIEFPDGVATTILLHLVKLCAEQSDFHEGLIRSMRISFFGGGSFARRLLRSPGMDFKYLYSQVLPAVAEGDPDVLWALASVNPEIFASWMRFPEIYEIYLEALISALRRVESHPRLIPGLMERWRSREAADPEAGMIWTAKPGPVKRRRTFRRNAQAKSRPRHRNQDG